eukprot:9850024-Ditylum_brightwellii.AAC.1
MVALSHTQLVAGSGLPSLNKVTADISYVPASWLSNIRTFLCPCKGKMTIQSAWPPALQWAYDRIIM